MPRKKKVTTVTEEIPEDEVPGTFPAAELPDDYELAQSVLSQFGDTGIKIKVSKQGPKGPEYCFSTEELDEDYIQQYFGGGRYVLRIYVNDQFQRSVPLNIADRKMLPNPNGGNQGNDSQNMVLELIRSQNTFLQGLLSNVMTGGGQRTPVGELTEAIKTLGFQNGAGGSDKIVEAIFKGMDLADRAGGGSKDWKSELFSVLRDVAPGVMDMMKNNQKPNTGGTAQPVQIPASVPITTTDNAPEVAALRQTIGYLKAQCMNQVPVDLIVDWTVSHAGDAQYQFFIGYALNTPFEEIAKLDGEITREPYKPWFESLINGLRSAFTESDTMDDTITPFPDGHKTDTPVNGGVGPKARAN